MRPRAHRVPEGQELQPATSIPDRMLEDQADEWFSTHDTSLVPGEPDMGGDVTATLETVSIPIFGSEVEKLKKRAAALGTDYRSYIRLLISRHLHEEEPLG